MKTMLKSICIVIALIMVCGAMFLFVGCNNSGSESPTPTNSSNPSADSSKKDPNSSSVKATAIPESIQFQQAWGIKDTEPLFVIVYNGEEHSFSAAQLYALGVTEAGEPFSTTNKMLVPNYSGVSFKNVLADIGVDVETFNPQEVIVHFADGNYENVLNAQDFELLACVLSPCKNHVTVTVGEGIFFVAVGEQSTEIVKEFSSVVKIEIK